MQTIQPSYYRGYTFGFAKQAVKTFITWCKNQEDNRYGWLAVMIFIHGCVLTPASLFSIFFSGNSMLSLSFVIGAMAMTLVSNLAAMPTKITIPIFLLSVLIDATIITINLVQVIG